ncbi:hypothetical protein AC1031_009940 [Aphanomyces cochlioides]|nr:hypothetical protein AC1031_009940 [Aphanomyces cochlioides]
MAMAKSSIAYILNQPTFRLKRDPRPCKVDFCTKHAKRLGLCWLHGTYYLLTLSLRGAFRCRRVSGVYDRRMQEQIQVPWLVLEPRRWQTVLRCRLSQDSSPLWLLLGSWWRETLYRSGMQSTGLRAIQELLRETWSLSMI